MRRVLFLVLLVSFVFSGLICGSAFADGVSTGRALVAQNRPPCPANAFSPGAGRTIPSLAALKPRVPWCSKAAPANLTPAEIASVVAYLNTTFYHFPIK